MFDIKTICIFQLVRKLQNIEKTADTPKFGANSDCYLSYKSNAVGDN